MGDCCADLYIGAIVTMSTDGSGIHDVTQRETIPLTSSDPQHINVNWDYGYVSFNQSQEATPMIYASHTTMESYRWL